MSPKQPNPETVPSSRPNWRRASTRLSQKYPVKRSALIPMLLYAQDEIGYLSDAVIAEVAQRIGITELEVRNVATYYSMLRFKPAGKFNIQVCTNISCMLRGAYDVYERFQEELGIGHKGVTADGVFSLEEVECIGACCWAPAIQVNYDFHDELKPDHVPGILSGYRGKAKTEASSRGSTDGKGPMPRLVSHPDEVKIVSRRFGMGAAKIDRYLELGGYESAKKCLAQGPDWIINEMKASDLRGRGGAGFSDGHEVVVRSQAVRQAQIRPGQRRRERARNLQGSPDLSARSSRRH